MKVHPTTKRSWHQLSALADTRDFYRGDGRGACRRMVERMIRRETAQVRADLIRMGQDPDAILASRGVVREVEPDSGMDFGEAERLMHDPA